MKIKLGIIFGGNSSEYKDSIDSFENIYNHLIKEESASFELTHVIYATRSGGAVVSSVDFEKSSDDYQKGTSIDLIDAFRMVKQEGLFLFSTLFSQNGEDGRLQGLASLMQIKTNLGEPLQPSLCISKYHLNRYVENLFDGLQVPQTYRISSIAELKKAWPSLIGNEKVLKPNSLGSSIYTDKIDFTDANYATIEDICMNIFKEDKFALVQEYIKGNEYTCAVLKINGEITALPVGEVVTNRGFFGFPEKNDIALNNKFILPDDHEMAVKIQKLSCEIFEDLDLSTVARFDYMYNGKDIYFLECNAFPSLHRYSFLMKMLGARGKDTSWLIDNIIKSSI